jgi:3-oxoacyl-[acyl-carrier protein] reductase
MQETEKKQRVGVVTGGSSGIGRAIATAFAHQGDQVIITARHAEELRAAAEAIGVNCGWQRADVSQSEQVAATVEAIVVQFGHIDVLVNNAGLSRGLFPEMTLAQAEEVWDLELDVNLKGAFLMSYAAAPHLTRPGGRIINISTDGALTGAVGLRTMGYVSAKAGLLGLTRAQAREYGPQGITANGIAPGFIAGTGATNRVPEDTLQSIAAQLPVRRSGSGDDIAVAALFLASPEAGFITGELLNVNGGRVFGA